MENKLDNLFKQKLIEHEENPSVEAWAQIHEHTKSRRRVLWGNRLAIAASFVLLAMVGFFGYKSTLDLGHGSESDKMGLSYELQEIEDETEAVNAGQVKDNAGGLPENLGYSDELEGLQKDPVEVNKENLHEEKNEQLVSGQKLIQNDLLTANDDQERMNTSSPDIANALEGKEIVEPDSRETATIAEQKDLEIEKVEPEQQAKVYPKIKITYKASLNSKLVATDKQSLIDKGISKISEFSGEHLLTNDRKTKLRNTKNDLLALNFGKLLNKSN